MLEKMKQFISQRMLGNPKQAVRLEILEKTNYLQPENVKKDRASCQSEIVRRDKANGQLENIRENKASCQPENVI